jgi:hypothetical protein
MNLQSIFRVMALVVVMLAVNSNVNAQIAERRTPSDLTFTVRSVSLEVGEVKTLTVTGLEKDERAEWTSSDKDIVTVEKDGTIRGQKEGKATITVTAGDRKASCDATVTARTGERPGTEARSYESEKPTPTNEGEKPRVNDVDLPK